ncbi:MAG: hypothetical protein WEC59_09870 [Salibacteraceae bacterium]
MTTKYDFHEKQYLGYNRFGIIRRTVIALFCLVFYYAAEADDQMKSAFFILAVAILFMSLVSILIQHLETRLEGSTLTLIGPMTFKKVQLDLTDIKNLTVKPYSRLILNRPLFNLHRKNSLRFYTHGKWCVEFETKDGDVITLGTQRPDGLKEILSKFEAGHS